MRGPADKLRASELSPEIFLDEYVATRTPVVVEGHLVDPEWRGHLWTLDYLVKRCGNVTVQVQERCAGVSFGPGCPERRMRFEEFIRALQRGEMLYLVAPYTEADGDKEAAKSAGHARGNSKKADVEQLRRDIEDSFRPRLEDYIGEPAASLLGEFPLRPALLGPLVPDSVNLWIGAGSPASSGLHYDATDNLYVLLRGVKRSALLRPRPPPSRPQLRPLPPDGRPAAADTGAARGREAQRPHRAAVRPRRARGPGPEAGGRAVPTRACGLPEAELAYWHLTQWREAAAAEGAGGRPTAEEEAAEEAGSSSGSSSEAEEEPDAHPNFSRLAPADVHRCLRLDGPEADGPREAAGELAGTSPRVVTVRAGQMLYLPAGWLHEVTSFPDPADGPAPRPRPPGSLTRCRGPHVAFNYWVAPPDRPAGPPAASETPFHEAPYADAEAHACLLDRWRALLPLVRARALRAAPPP